MISNKCFRSLLRRFGKMIHFDEQFCCKRMTCRFMTRLSFCKCALFVLPMTLQLMKLKETTTHSGVVSKTRHMCNSKLTKICCFGIQMGQNHGVSKRFAFHETVYPPVHKSSSLDIDRSLHLQRILSQGSPVS